MTYLPQDKKSLIQNSYVRFRELTKELPEVDKRFTVGQFAYWAGLIALGFWIVRIFIGNEWPSIVGGLAMASVVVGWAYKSDMRKKQLALWEERRDIRKQMEEIGVHFSDTSGRVTVYAGSIADENIVSPLGDASYR